MHHACKKIYQPTKQIGPAKIVHCIFFMTNGARNYLSIDMVMQLLLQTTLNREWFVQKLKVIIRTKTVRVKDYWIKIYEIIRKADLLIKALFGFMNKNNCFSMLIILWSTCTTHHLQNICDWKVNVSL